MSMTRNLFHEIRPFFRLFDDVSRMHPAYPIVNRPFGRQFEPFLQQRHPSIDLTEQGNEYIVEAEVPGVKKENLNVRVGDGGRSITVEGQIFSRTHSEPVENIDTATSQAGAQGETRGERKCWVELRSAIIWFLRSYRVHRHANATFR